MPSEFAPAIPAEWFDALEYIAPTVTEKMADTAVQGDDWLTNLTRLGTVLVMTNQQRELLDVQLDRARQGLPPLDLTAYQPGVSVGLSDDSKKFIGWGIAGVLAFMLLQQAGSR